MTRKVVPVREEKKRIFKNIEEQENIKIKEIVLPVMLCHIASNPNYPLDRTMDDYNIYTTNKLTLSKFIKTLMSERPFPDVREAYLYSRLYAYFTDQREKLEKIIRARPVAPRIPKPGRQKKVVPEVVFPLDPWICIPVAAISEEKCNGL